jgi:adenylate cyclase
MIIPSANVTTAGRPATAGTLSSRRTVTVLFIDIVGFTALVDRLDPEDVWALQKDYFATVTRAVLADGGVVEKYIGDAVMAVFGAGAARPDTPQTVGDAAARAARAGLRMQEALRDYPLAGRFPVRTRVGVATGEAIVDVAAGNGGQAMISGSVVATASRLQAYAPQGTVVVCAATRQVTDALISYQELPPVAVAGKPYPIELWRALAPQPAEPVAQPVEQPVGQPAVQPVARPGAHPVAQPVVRPVLARQTEPAGGRAARTGAGARLPVRVDACTAAVPVWIGPGVALARRGGGTTVLTRAGPAVACESGSGRASITSRICRIEPSGTGNWLARSPRSGDQNGSWAGRSAFSVGAAR